MRAKFLRCINSDGALMIVEGRRSGFSLVEVTLCLGVVAFALVALMGILPVGLMSAREAITQTAQTQILKRISSELELLPFTDLSAYIAQSRTYDYDGKETTNSSDAVYEVKLSAAAANYPGSSNVAGLSDHLRDVRVTIQRPALGTNAASVLFQAALPAVNNYELQ